MSHNQNFPTRVVGIFAGLLGLFLISTSPSLGSGCPCNYTPANLIDVVTADTLLLEVADIEETVQVAGIRVPRLESQSGSDEAWCKAEGGKAIQARDYARTLLSEAAEISIDETERLASGTLIAVVYIDNVSFGQELLYEYLAVETGEVANWCP